MYLNLVEVGQQEETLHEDCLVFLSASQMWLTKHLSQSDQFWTDVAEKME
jgi:hypothetical protein